MSSSTAVPHVNGIPSVNEPRLSEPSTREIESGQPFLGGWLEDAFDRRKRNGQDIIIFIDDYENDRGTGKTALSLKLAEYLDQTDEGLTYDKCFMKADKLVRAYKEEPRGSALLLDEAEMDADKYQSGSKSNRALRKIVSMGRVMEKYVIFNMPNIDFIDRDLQSLGHAWLSVECLGRARVHKMGYNKYQGQNRTPLKHRTFWNDLRDEKLLDIYSTLTEDKIDHIVGDGSEVELLRMDEARELAEKEAEKAAMEQRNKLIAEFYETTPLTYAEIGDVVGLTGQRISDIVKEVA